MLMVELLLHLAVSTTNPIDFLLQHFSLVGLLLDIAFHVVYFRLSLAHLIFDLVSFL